MPIFHLTLRGPLHQGEFVGINREAALDWIPSDSLFAMLVTAWTQTGVDMASRLAGFEAGPPPFLLTSAFPHAGSVRFYPAPQRLPQAVLDSGVAGKTVKKIRWLSAGALDLLRQGQALETAEANFLHGRTVWLTVKEREAIKHLLAEDDEGGSSLWRFQVVPHVTVDRASNASNLFHTGRVTFSPDCGLWFAVRGQANDVREALKYLADAGLGGLRSTGHGAFSFRELAEELPEATDEWGLSLSRYAPASQAEIEHGLQDERSAYKLVTVGGWCVDDTGGSWRRRAVRLVAEGALLPAGARGRLVDVRPEKPEAWKGPMRPVYRSGLAFLTPAGKLVEAV